MWARPIFRPRRYPRVPVGWVEDVYQEAGWRARFSLDWGTCVHARRLARNKLAKRGEAGHWGRECRWCNS